jgi:hypothetical protein
VSDRQECSILSTLPANRFHSCVLTTFSFDFNYFHHGVLAALSRAGVVNTCIFADDHMLQQYLGTMTGYATNVIRRYSLSGIVRKGAFHPKLYLFFGRDENGFLIVGSGNLTSSGHGSNQELWGAFHIDGPKDPKAQLFKHAWTYAYNLGLETSGIARNKIDWIQQNTPWLNEIPESPKDEGINITEDIKVFLLSNANGNIFSSIHRHIGNDQVCEITLISPFFDSKDLILQELINVFEDAEVHAIIQPDSCVASFKESKHGKVVFHDWDTIPGSKKNRYLHAKLLHIRTDKHEYCMFGSANMTAPALGTRNVSAINEEICLLFCRENGNWLDELGLSEKGKIIANSDISCAEPKITNKDYSNTTWSVRLKAIDRLATTLRIYLDKTVNTKDLALKLYDGWGNTILKLPFMDAEYKKNYDFYKLCNNELSEDILYGQLIDSSSGAVVSNKHIIHDIQVLSRTNPDPNNQKMEDVLTRMEVGDTGLLDILSYLNPDDLVKKDDEGTDSQRTTVSDDKQKGDGTGELLEYDDFTKTSPEYSVKEGFSYLYGTHRIERVLETLRTIFEKLKIQDMDISAEDEETDKEAVETSEGRFDYDESLAKGIHRETPSGFVVLQKTVFRFFNQYINILERQRQLKHRPNILDVSMFTISLHLLLDLFNKQIHVRKQNDIEGEHFETLLPTDGNYFKKTDYCRIIADIIGKFTLLLINKIDDLNDEHVRKRIKKCKSMAYWHGICCIARLVPSSIGGKNSKDLSELWKWELGLNLQRYFSPEDTRNEATAAEEIGQRMEIMASKDNAQLKAHIASFWKRLVNQFDELKSVPLSKEAQNNKLSLIFCEICGYGHIYRAAAYDDDYTITLARPGYLHNKEKCDFEEGKRVVAEIAKLQCYGKSILLQNNPTLL